VVRNQLAVDLALAGKDMVPEPTHRETSTQLELPLDPVATVEEEPRPAESAVDRDRAARNRDSDELDEDFESSVAP
jgi:hypothetical protein